MPSRSSQRRELAIPPMIMRKSLTGHKIPLIPEGRISYNMMMD